MKKNNYIMKYTDYIGKYIYVQQGYPVWLFNITSYDAASKQVFAEQIVCSNNDDDVEVYCGPEWDVDPTTDKVIGVFDTPEELFETITDYLREQIEKCTGMVIKK